MKAEKTRSIIADALFQLLKKHAFEDITIRKAFTVTDQNSLTSHVYRAAKEYYKNHIEAAQKKPISEDMSLTIIAFASGVLAVTKEWIRNDFHTDPEVLARIIFEAMPAKMQVFFCYK